MKLPRLILREIAFRKISFVASLVAVCASVCCVVASFELLKDHDDVLLIDVRQPQELADAGLIEGSLHIPSQDLPHRLEDMPLTIVNTLGHHGAVQLQQNSVDGAGGADA